MVASDESVAGVIEAFQAAGVGAAPWADALEGLAAVTGSKHAQLGGIGPEGARPFNWLTRAPPEMLAEFAEVGGTDSRVNPRARALTRAAELQVLADEDFTSPGQGLRPDYSDWVRRYDVPFICLTPLVRRKDLLVGLSVVRGSADGHVTDSERRVFAAVAAHARQAVRTQMLLQTQAATLLAGSMEALSLCVFVCDSRGAVRAMSAQAEALLAAGGHLKLDSGSLTACRDVDGRALSAAIHEASFIKGVGPRPPTILVVAGAEEAEPLLVEVAAVPGEGHNFGLGAACLVIARSPRHDAARVAAVARALYRLTQAEGAVVAHLVGGTSAAAIAEQAGLSVETIRTHIRRIFQKAGVSSQVELIANVASRL